VDANVAKEFLAKPGAITEWLLGSRAGRDWSQPGSSKTNFSSWRA